MATPTISLSRQISLLSLLFGTVLVTALGSFGWWAASSIDDRSMARQSRAVQRGFAEIIERIPVEQDSFAIGDEAVINLKSGNEQWIADNLGERMSEYFKHDLIYILDGDDLPIRAVANGKMADVATYFSTASPIHSLVAEVRRRLHDDSRHHLGPVEADQELGVEDVIILGNGLPAIVSIRPVLPGTNNLSQSPGTEFLHISMRIVDGSVAAEISEQYELPGLTFQRTTAADPERLASPVFNSQGRVVGFFTWVPEEPAFELISGTLPVTIGCLALGGTAVFLLLRRLHRTSSRLEQAQAEASFLAFHDPLTGLPNRALFEDRLEQALAKMRNGGSPVTLLYIDLDHFKRVNDGLGHAVGDELLCQASHRLTDLASSIDTVSRLGGDEFAFILFDTVDTAFALTLGHQIVENFTPPFSISGHDVQIGASVGIAIIAEPTISAEDVMRQADIALYKAKGSGRSCYHSYDGELNSAIKERRELEIELRKALAGDVGLGLVYQPIFSALSNTIVGAEALLRWDHPKLGRLSPATFVPLAEERGLIDQLGLWVLHQACAYAATSALPWVAVNASPLQFRDEKFADKVFEVLQTTGLQARRLEIEITEGLLLQNSPLTQSTLNRLRAAGIRVALDDFGTGYSSISYLRSHGIDKLKIDQSFTAQLGQGRDIDKIVQSIVDLARAMNMAVTAEGVETEAQRATLQAMGCNQLQGYLLSRPVQASSLNDMMSIGPASEPRQRARV